VLLYNFACSYCLTFCRFICVQNSPYEKSSHVKEDTEPQEHHIVIDPAKAFCQHMKFIVRMKKRMKQFKTKKDSMENREK